MRPIDPHLQRLQNPDGFIEFYLELLCDYDTCEQAYDAAERTYQFVYGQRRYSDYDTFRVILNRHRKVKRKR